MKILASGELKIQSPGVLSFQVLAPSFESLIQNLLYLLNSGGLLAQLRGNEHTQEPTREAQRVPREPV
jgi:hypothetical protein